MTQLSEIDCALFKFPCVHERRGVQCGGLYFLPVCECHSAYISIYSRPQRSTSDVHVCYAAEEQEVRLLRSGRQLQI